MWQHEIKTVLEEKKEFTEREILYERRLGD